MSHSILIVDHTSELVEFAVSLLTEEINLTFDYHHVKTQNDLATALQRLPWHLIICRFELPTPTADEILLLVQNSQPHTPVLFVAEHVTVQEAVRMMRLGARGIAAKTDRSQLIDWVKADLQTPPLNTPAPLPSHAPLQYQTTLLQQVSDAVIATDNALKITAWNPAATSMYGWTEAEAIGQPIDELLKTEWLTQSLIEAQTSISTTGVWRGEIRQQTKEGKFRYILAAVSLLYDQGNIIGGITINHDITERKRQDLLQAGLSYVLEAIADNQPLPTVLEYLVQTIEGYDSDIKGSVLLLDHTTQQLHLGAAPSLPDAYNAAIDGLHIGAGVGSCGTAAYEKHLVIVEDTLTHPFWLSFRELANQHGLRACWSQPIMDRDGVVLGTFALYYEQPHYPSEAELALIRLAAHIAGIAVRHTQNQTALRKSQELFHRFMQHLPATVFILDQHNRLTYCNSRYAGSLGLQADDIIGKAIEDYLPPEVAKIAAIENEQVLAQNQAGEFFYSIGEGENLAYWQIIKFLIPQGNDSPLIGAISLSLTKEKQTEAALRASEARYRGIVEDQTELVCRYNSELKITFGNAAYCKFYGVSPEEVVGKSILDRIPPEEHAQIWEYFQSLSQENPVSISIHHSIRADGSSGWFEWKDRVIFDEHGQISEYQGVGRDISEQRYAEEALRASEARYRQMFELHGLPKLIIEPESGQIVDANPTAGEFYGYDIATLKTLTIFDVTLSPPEVVAAKLNEAITSTLLSSHFAQQAAGGQTRDVEIFTGRLDIQGKPFLYAIITDVTERQLARKALEEANNLLEQRVLERTLELEKVNNRVEAIFNHSGDGLLLLDIHQGIQQANYAFDLLFEVESGSYLGMNLTSFFDPESTITIQTTIQEVATSHQKRQIEAKAKRADGTFFEVEISLAPVNRSAVSVTNLVCIVRDISERKEAEAALQKYTDEISDLYNNAPAGYHSLNGEGVVIQINETELRWLGYTREEVVGKLKLSDLATPAGNLIFQKKFPIFKQQGWISDLEFDLRRKDGSLLTVLLSATAVLDEAGQFSHSRSTLFDITELKRAQQAIAEERNLLRTVIDAVPDFIYVKDIRHRMVLNNLAHAHSLGVNNPSEAVGKTDFELFPPEMASKFHQDEEELFRTGSSILNAEESSIGETGHEIWALTTKVPLRNLQGELIGLVGITRDVSKIKANEEALRRSEQQLQESQKMLQLVLDTIPVRVFWKDRSSTYLGCNRLFAEDAGLPHTQAIIGVQDHVLPWAAHKAVDYRADDLAVMISGEPKLEYEETLTVTNSKQLIIQTNKLPLRDTNDRVIGVLGAYVDITDRKQAEIALAKKHQEEHEMQSNLKALHEITLRLTRIETLDDFYKAVVEEAQQHFNFERVALLLYKAETGVAIGTYGTDPMGKIVPEHSLQLDPDSLTGILKKTLDRSEQFAFEEDTLLFANSIPIGRGSNAVAALWNGHVLGWLAIDNGVHHQPITKLQLDILVLYALTVGSLLARKQVENALSESEARYRFLAENIKDVIVKSSPQGIGTYVTPSCYELIGYRPDELVDEFVFNLIHPDDRPSSQEKLHQALVSGANFFSVTHRIRHKRGHYIWVEITSTIVRHPETHEPLEIIGIVHDITERKQAENSLRASEEKYRQLVETMRGGLAMYDLEDRITYVNDRFCELLGYQRDELIGTFSFDYVDKVNHEIIAQHLQQRRTAESSSYELPVRHKSGQLLYLLISGSPLFNENRDIIGSFAITIDITAQKLAETALQQALDKEKELGELKSRFVSMASHEFRTPLATILATTETLTFYRDRMDEAKIAERLQKIRTQVLYMKDIMEEVLQLARIQAGYIEFKPTGGNFDKLCQEIVEEFESHEEHHGRIIYTSTSSSVPLYFDEHLIRQVINNLISNALKYSDKDKPIYIDLTDAESEVIFTVKDQGIGIPPDDLLRLFEPFHRAANVGTVSGTGLGLSIAKRAIELHNGLIIPETQVQTGTVFTVKLPRTTNTEN